MTDDDTQEGDASDADSTQIDKDNENNASKGAARISRARKGGPLSFRNMAILAILIVGGAVGYEVWKNPDLIGPSRVSRTPNVDDTPAGDQLRTSERYQGNLRQ